MTYLFENLKSSISKILLVFFVINNFLPTVIFAASYKVNVFDDARDKNKLHINVDYTDNDQPTRTQKIVFDKKEKKLSAYDKKNLEHLSVEKIENKYLRLSTSNFSLRIDGEGKIIVSDLEKSSILTGLSLNTLNDVHFEGSKTLNFNHLLINARKVINFSDLNVETLKVRLQEKKSNFTNSAAARLSIGKKLTMGGKLVNQGDLTATGKQVIFDMGGFAIENQTMGHVKIDETVLSLHEIIAGKEKKESKKINHISAAHDLFIRNFSTFNNNTALFSESGKIKLQGKNVTNNGYILAATELNLDKVTCFKNNFEKKIVTNQLTGTATTMVNKGHLEIKKSGHFTVDQSFVNKGDVVVLDSFALTCGELENGGDIHSHNTLTLKARELLNLGVILSDNSLAMTIDKQGRNDNQLLSRGRLTLLGEGQLINRKTIKAEKTLELAINNVENRSILNSDGEMIVEKDTKKILNALGAQIITRVMGLRSEATLENHGILTANCMAGFLGALTNTAQWNVNLIKNLTVNYFMNTAISTIGGADNFKVGTLINTNKIEFNEISHLNADKVINKSEIVFKKTSHFLTAYLNNQAQITAKETLFLATINGENTGGISARELRWDIHDLFTQKNQVTAGIIGVSGPGRLQNDHHITGTYFTFSGNDFYNSATGIVIAKKDGHFLSSVKKWKNEGIITGQNLQLHMVAQKEEACQNKGQVTAENFMDISVSFLKNEGGIEAEILKADISKKMTNAASATLLGKKAVFTLGAGRLINHGLFKSDNLIEIQNKSFFNNSILLSAILSVDNDRFNNAGAVSSNKVDIKTRRFYNKGTLNGNEQYRVKSDFFRTHLQS